MAGLTNGSLGNIAGESVSELIERTLVQRRFEGLAVSEQGGVRREAEIVRAKFW